MCFVFQLSETKVLVETSRNIYTYLELSIDAYQKFKNCILGKMIFSLVSSTNNLIFEGYTLGIFTVLYKTNKIPQNLGYS